MGLDKAALSERLEQLVDSEGLANVVECLADVCREKSEQVQHNWQDKPLATEWQRAGNMLSRISNRVAV